MVLNTVQSLLLSQDIAFLKNSLCPTESHNDNLRACLKSVIGRQYSKMSAVTCKEKGIEPWKKHKPIPHILNG